MWSDKKVDEKVQQGYERFVAFCEGYRGPCREERMAAEQTLADSLGDLIKRLDKSQREARTTQLETQRMLLVGTFTMDALAKKLGMPQADLDRIKTNVANGTLK